MRRLARSAPLLEANISLKFVGDGRMVAAHGGKVIGKGAARDALVVPAVERRRQAQMRGAGGFPVESPGIRRFWTRWRDRKAF
jgi:hypothetical protein